jgi:hypothetical protein
MSIKYTIMDMYIDGNMNKRIDYPTYRKVWEMFCDKIMREHIIEKGGVFNLPGRLGNLRVSKKKAKSNKLVDFNKTRQLGYTVYHRNFHSDNYIAFFNWYTTSKCRNIFKYKPSQKYKRYLAHLIQNENAINIYFENE